MAIGLKENKFLIDGDILKECLLENDKYISTDNEERLEKFQSFNALLGKSSGYLYNIEGIEKILQDLAGGMEVEGLSQGALYMPRINKMMRQTDGSNSSWEPLEDSAYTLVEDNGEDWSALFYHKNVDNSNETAIEWANKNLHHSIGFGELFSKKGLFYVLVKQFKDTLKNNHSPEDFFKPFNLLSKSYVIYDPFLFQSGGYFGMGEKDNVVDVKLEEKSKKPQSYYKVRNHLTLYLDWIYRCYEKSSYEDLPIVYLGGRRGSNRSKIPLHQIKKFEDAFINKVFNSKNDHPSIAIFKKFIEKDKLKFFYISNKEYKNQSLVHANAIMTCYGIIKWDKRRSLFNEDFYAKNELIHETKSNHSLETRNFFNTFRQASIEENEISYFDTFKYFSKKINEEIK